MDWWEEDPGKTSELNEYELCPCGKLFSECECTYVQLRDDEDQK